MSKLKLMSCNLNSLRAAYKKGLGNVIERVSPDIFAIQETKVHEENLNEEIRNIGEYTSYFHSQENTNFAGVAIYTKLNPINVEMGLGIETGIEGRLIRMDFENFTLINTYCPSGWTKERLIHKHEYINSLIDYVTNLKEEGNNIIMCGDFNIAHEECDTSNPSYNGAGFLKKEREMIGRLIDNGFTDTFRLFNDESGHYTWKSYKARKANENKGYRFDYFFVNDEIKDKVTDSYIIDENISDHCQIILELENLW